MRIRLLCILLFLTAGLAAQTRKDTLQTYAGRAWTAHQKRDYARAEQDWRRALHYGRQDTVIYNLGRDLQAQQRSLEALQYYQYAGTHSKNDSIRARAWNNAGDIYLQNKQWQQALESYKNSLRANPDDEIVRQKYAYVKKQLEKQRKQNKQNKNQPNKNNQNNKNQNQQNKQNQNQQNKQNQQKKQDQNNRQNQQNKQDQQQKKNKGQNKDKQNNKQNNKQNQDQKQRDNQAQNKQNQQQKNQNRNGQKSGQQKQNQEGQPQKRRSKLSPEQTKYLLNALKNKEKQTLKKIRWQRGRGQRRKQEKDW